MQRHYVYWYHLEEHSDPYTQGYVGVTCDLHVRHNAHKNGHAGGSRILNSAFKKYGEEQIHKTILHETSKEQAYVLEQKYRPSEEIGWNIAMGGGLPPDTTGRIDPPEVCRKRAESVRKAKAGKFYPSVFKGMTNRHSEEQRKRIGDFHRGKIISDAHKRAISEKMIGGDSPKAKTIHLVHKDEPTDIHTFPCVKVAADTLGLNYNTLRSQYQYSLKAKKTSDPARSGWICLYGKDVMNPVTAVAMSVSNRSKRNSGSPKAKGKANHKSQSVVLENKEGETKTFESVNQAAIAIGISEATLRYHKQQTLKKQQDSGFNKQDWKVKYTEGTGVTSGINR